MIDIAPLTNQNTPERVSLDDRPANRMSPSSLPNHISSTSHTSETRLDISISQCSRQMIDVNYQERGAVMECVRAHVASPTRTSAPTVYVAPALVECKAQSAPPATTSVQDDLPPSGPRKHKRGSIGRHTLSVDIQWLRRLVPQIKSNRATPEGTHTNVSPTKQAVVK
jgi:hypothetical protein